MGPGLSRSLQCGTLCQAVRVFCHYNLILAHDRVAKCITGNKCSFPSLLFRAVTAKMIPASSMKVILTNMLYSLPSLLKPIEAPQKFPILAASRPPDLSKIKLPGASANLTYFTYRVIGHGPRRRSLGQQNYTLPITTFLATNCPNLQHLRVGLFFPSNSYVEVESYSRFTEVLIAKPNLKTPKTFVGLDVQDCLGSGNQEWSHNRLSGQLVGWEVVGLGEFRSVVNKH